VTKIGYTNASKAKAEMRNQKLANRVHGEQKLVEGRWVIAEARVTGDTKWSVNTTNELDRHGLKREKVDHLKTKKRIANTELRPQPRLGTSNRNTIMTARGFNQWTTGSDCMVRINELKLHIVNPGLQDHNRRAAVLSTDLSEETEGFHAIGEAIGQAKFEFDKVPRGQALMGRTRPKHVRCLSHFTTNMLGS
jgi:hypothetical protein